MPPFLCHSCGAAVPYDEPIPRDSECESCGADLRACRNCRHHDPALNNQCRETMADPVEDKHRRNFCEYFSFDRATSIARADGAREGQARARLAGLFGDTPAAKPSGREKLDALFGGPTPREDRGARAREELDRLFGDKSKGKKPESER